MLSHSKKSYSEVIHSSLGRGREHAARLYSHWMKKGTLEGLEVEPQAQPLIQEMIALSDFALPLISAERADENAIKFLLKFTDGMESESVFLPMKRAATLCISSQIGCQMGCTFCETGRMGLLRNLTAAEIVSQVFIARHSLRLDVRNIVFMGMGEPFDNFDQVMQAVAVLTDPSGLGFGPSRITISTSGRVEEIYRMIDCADPALNLAVSVNAPNDQIRRKIMPVNRKWDMAALKQAMIAYCAHPRREIFAEYVLLQGVNDSLECADQLAEYLKGLRVKVNLIPYNPQTRDRFAPPEEPVREAFLKRMRSHGYLTLLRKTKGQQVMAACGQLGNTASRKLRPISTA